MNPRPIRVLILSARYPPVYSGAALQVHDVLRRLGREVVEGTVLMLRLPSLKKRAMLDGVRILRLGRGAGRLTRFLFAFQVFGYVLLRGGRYDVVHSVSPGWAIFLLPLACRMRGVPALFTSGREAMGRAARETVQRRFSMKLIASQYLELYRRLASAGAS